jgi:hypothetical protein
MVILALVLARLKYVQDVYIHSNSGTCYVFNALPMSRYLSVHCEFLKDYNILAELEYV